MGVLLTAVLIVAGAGAGVWSERRYPEAAVGLARRFLLVILYLLVPIVIFFNLAKATITLGGIFGLVPLVALLFWWLRPTARRGWLKWLIVLTTPMGLPTYFGFRWAMYLAAR